MRMSLKSATLLSAGLVLGLTTMPAYAQNPSTQQLIQQLSPSESGLGTTRGIRLGGAGAGAPAAAPPAARASATATAPAAQGQANLSVPFATGSAEISASASAVLDRLGAALTSPNLSGFKFRVEGHTDTTGQPDANKVLSEQRAAAVTDYLVTRFKIDRSRLTPVGMGQEDLLVQTGPGVSNAANRRVVVVNLGS